MRVRRPELALVVLLLCGTAVSAATASTPPSQTLTAPTALHATTTIQWTGTIPPGSNPPGGCTVPGTDDQHGIAVRIPAAARGFVLELSVEIAWRAEGDGTTSDEVLTLLAPDGSDAGDSDGGTPHEKVVVNEPVAGSYTAVACGLVNAAAQPYTGKATLTAIAPVKGPAPLPTVDHGLGFGASTPSDVQRDVGEPAVTTDRDGNIYTCGPAGFANLADYANVSTDGGDQFHLLGQPPRGQLSEGGGGDCALATAVQRNAQGHYALAYAGLDTQLGYATATSPDGGHTLQTSPTGLSLPGVDRQWLTFVDAKTALLAYNSLGLNMVVLRSTDAGLTYGPPTQAADVFGTIGQIRAHTPAGKDPATQSVVYFPLSRDNVLRLAISRDSGATFDTCLLLDAGVSPDAKWVSADHDDAGNIYVVYAERHGGHDVYLLTLPASKAATCAAGRQAAVTRKVRVNREGIDTAVMPWIAAGGLPGRVAVAYYGSQTDGDPSTGDFRGTWNVYVSQSLDALAAAPHFDQVTATTHPFHYDSICLDGLGCDVTVPPGDRTLVDFFSIAYNRKSGRLNLAYSNAAKRPGDAAGNLSQPTVLVQSSGPSNGGGTVHPRHPVVAAGTADPAGDALSQYSSVLPRTAESVNSTALDLRSASVVPTQQDFAVTLRVGDLSDAALQQALDDNAPARGLVWMFRWVNGYQPAAVTVRWSPSNGFSGGFDDYVVQRTAAGRVQSYAGTQPLGDDVAVDQAKGTITFRVRAQHLNALHGPQGPGQRPMLEKALPGARFYDGYAATFADMTTGADAYLYPADNAPTFDFTLRPRTTPPVRSRVAAPSKGGLPSTGLEPTLPWLALVLIGLGLHRRRMSR